MWLIAGRKKLDSVVEAAVERAHDEAQNFLKRYKTVTVLNEEIETLRIEKARKEEEFNKREREVEHKVGLERKRQEFEITQAKRETVVEVREENLEADKDRFKAEMDFQRKRLEGEVESLRDLVTEMMKRLPSAEIYANLGGSKD